MNFLKEFLRLFIDPIKVIGNKKLSLYISDFFEKNKFCIYLLAFIMTFLLFVILNKFDIFIEFFKSL